jgi:hypothetical protein
MLNMRLKLLLPFMLLAGCCKAPSLALHSNYITMESRASFHARTPDPAWQCPTLGQRIYVQWNLSPDEFTPPLELVLSMHYGDRTEGTESISLLKAQGWYIYELINDEYFAKMGIVAYKAELWREGQVIKTWRHLLWEDKIPVSSPDS